MHCFRWKRGSFAERWLVLAGMAGVLGVGAAGCVRPIRLYEGAKLGKDEAARLRVDGAVMLGGALKVRRVDDEWGDKGGSMGFYFNDPKTWATKIDLAPGEHTVELSYEGMPSAVLKAPFAAGHEYSIELVKERPACVRLLEPGGPALAESCYEPSDALTKCAEPKAHLVYSMGEARKEARERVIVVLQSVDGTYGPNDRFGMYFFNELRGGVPKDLDLELCPGEHELVVAAETPQWGPLWPLSIRHAFEPGKRYRLVPQLEDPEPVKPFQGSSVRLRWSRIIVEPLP
ncbi:MAG TPA: hypothetical protein PLU22_16965 [Polyangiaceae bacterium]|nr:hypothetical protein [Polyangiaceae bacterium]